MLKTTERPNCLLRLSKKKVAYGYVCGGFND